MTRSREKIVKYRYALDVVPQCFSPRNLEKQSKIAEEAEKYA
jgi:hypothetical protein